MRKPSADRKALKIIQFIFAVAFAAAMLSAPARAGFLDLDEVKEVKLGKEAAEAVIKYYGLTGDAAEARRVSAIGREVVKICDRTGIEYHFYVIDSDMINAFALPGGYIFMTSGLMDFVDDDDELASVIAHEVTHIAKKHGVVMYKKSMKDAMVNFLILVLTRDPNAIVAGQMMQQSRADIYGRSAEIEADRFGLEYAYKAGYDPAGFMRFIMKLQRYETHSPDMLYDYYDSHPPMELRIELIAENFRRLGLEPPKGLNYEIAGRLIAMEVCEENGKKCYGAIKGPQGELLRIGDAGEQGSPYLRARRIVAALNRLFAAKVGIYEVKKISDAGGAGLIARNTVIARALKGDVDVNNAESEDALADMWLNNLKKFLWNDFLKEDL